MRKNEATKENVERFVRSFGEDIQVISSAKLGRNERKYRCLLLCCVVDTMSNIVDLPNSGGADDGVQEIDKRRFLFAVERFGNWPDCTRVCRPYLEQLLNAAPAPEFDDVRQFVTALPPWPDGCQSVVAVAKVDPEFSELAAIWPKTAGTDTLLRINRTQLKSLQHHELLYACRNKLTHEMRALISESEDSCGHTRPYYHRTTDWNGTYWQLYQPPGFLARMAEDILRGLQNYCSEKGLEPFSRLFPDRYWFERPY